MTEYHLLTAEQANSLRRERVLALERDLYRAELAMQDAQSDQERGVLAGDIAALSRRLAVHYPELGLIEPATGGHVAIGESNGAAPSNWDVPTGS